MYLVVWEGKYADDGIAAVYETHEEALQEYENLKLVPETRACYIALIDQLCESDKAGVKSNA